MRDLLCLMALGLLIAPGCNNVPNDLGDDDVATDDDDAADDDTADDDSDDDDDTTGDDDDAVVDEDGDGAVAGEDCDDTDPALNLDDADKDGYSTCDGDCDDNNPFTWPGAKEFCDGNDNDCDGFVPPMEADLDGDGYGTCQGDCDDTDPDLEPADVDNDGYSTCDGDCDDFDPQVWPEDLDNDGFSGCTGDCDDTNPDSNPLAQEICDGQDNNCDGQLPPDEQDVDQDGQSACDGDCDDNNPAVRSGAPDICDGVADNNCDGVTDPGETDGDLDGATLCDGDCDDADALLNLVDGDNDGYSTCDGECNDGDASVNPGVAEICNDLVDNDCDGGPGDCGVYGNIQAHQGDARIHGWWGNQMTGDRGLAQAGDVNGDGVDDVFVGNHGDDDAGSNAGAGHLFLGPIATGQFDVTIADAKFTGEAAGDRLGQAAAGAGDVDGDQLPDLLLGAYLEGSGGTQAGAAYLIVAPQVGVYSIASATAKFVGEADYDQAGSDVAGVGDVNDDGWDDLLIGAPYNDAGGIDAGAAYLILGPVTGVVDLSAADAKLVGEAADDEAGTSVSAAGDVDNDGFADILVGAPQADLGGNDSGVAYLFYGPFAGEIDLSAADARLYGQAGEETTHLKGISGAGDVNADGYDDVLVGAPRHDHLSGNSDGAAYLFHGPIAGDLELYTADAEMRGLWDYDQIGWYVSGAGDVDADGYDDVLVGAPWASSSPDEGEAYLLYGPLPQYWTVTLFPNDGTARIEGQDWDDYTGQVRAAGDLNSDGYGDFFVASEQNYGDAGTAFVFFGGTL